MNKDLSLKNLMVCLFAGNISIASVMADTSANAENNVSNQGGSGHRHFSPADRCKSLTDRTVKAPFTRGSAGHILVEGQFNNHSEVAVVDTGGIGVGGVVSEKVMSVIQPQDKSLARADVQGANHSRAMKVTKLQSAGIAKTLSEQLSFVVSPSAVLPDEAEALIGSEFLCSFTVEFDFKNNQLVLHPKNKSLDKLLDSEKENDSLVWGTINNESQIAGAIVMDMTVNDKPIKAVLDTGARHSIINWKAAKLMGIEKDSPRITVEENKAKGIHGDAAKESYRINVKQLGIAKTNIAAKDIDVRIADMGSFRPLVGDAAAINLGVDFFEGRRLIIDYKNRKVAVSD